MPQLPPKPEYAGFIEARFRSFIQKNHGGQSMSERDFKVMHDTFFCGALVLFEQIQKVAASKEDSMKVQVEFMESIYEELNGFMQTMYEEVLINQLNSGKIIFPGGKAGKA